MKKIKLLSLILAILMLAGVATLFASCGTEAGVITPSEDTVDVDFTGYTVLYGETQSDSNFTRTIRNQFDAFVARLSAATGVNVKLKQASREDIDDEAKEILIGLTDREESAKALKKIDGDGFIIQVLDNKIVIIGTSNLYTAMAVDYFGKTYFAVEEPTKTLTINETVKANEMGSVLLSDSTYKSEDKDKVYTYVYKNGLGMVPSPYVNLNTDVTSKPGFKEAPMIAAEKLAETMSTTLKLALKFFPVGNDATTTDKEVLIGITGREESKAALAEIDETQYIIAVRGERVVINAWNNMILTQAVEAYNDIIKEATVKDAAGNITVKLPRDFRLVGDGEHNWVTDFPKPEGENVQLYNTMDNNDNSLQYIYRGEGVTKAAYDAYVAQLKAAGYTELTKAGNAVEGSIFKFFTNKAKDTALYVAFNAYTHKGDYAEYDDTIIKQIDKKVIDPYGFENTLRIISSTIDNAFLPDTSLLSATSYAYQTQTNITTMPIYSQAVGHCHIITLEDGSFIVYDGGGRNAGSREMDTIWNVLNELHYQVWGKEASRDEPIRVAAWVLSHAHWDHYTAFREMLKTYGSTGKIKMDYMIANIPSNEAYSSTDFSEVGGAMTPDDIKIMQKYGAGEFKLIKPHTGMKFHIRNVEFETLTTWEDLNPVMCSNTNDTNTVFRLTISSQNSSDKTTLIWLGDANRLQSRFMCATYGTYLKSDMSTIAHHGNAGCEIDLYEMIDPETYFWMHHARAVQDYLNPAEKGWINQVDQYIAYTQASVKRIFANGGQMFTSGTGTPMDQISGGEIPASDGYMQLRFVDGVADYENIKELHFTYQKDASGKWTSVPGAATITDLQHTDISGGAQAFEKNQYVMTFASNYMVKCAQGCPTGQHTH